MEEGRESSTGLAAAIVAGVMARNLTVGGISGTYLDWINQLTEALTGSPHLPMRSMED